jgi:hypothetical protein
LTDLVGLDISLLNPISDCLSGDAQQAAQFVRGDQTVFHGDRFMVFFTGLMIAL